MTKEELEKKFNEIAENHYKTSGHVPTEWAVINFKAGFDSAMALLLPRLEEAEKVIEFYADFDNWIDVEGRINRNYVVEVDDNYKIGGKRARQYLEKKNE